MIDKFKDILLQRPKIVVVAHLNPDGDAIGSSLALGGTLRKSGYDVTVVLPNKPSPNLRVMSGYDSILFNTTDTDECSRVVAAAELVICLDFNDIHERIGLLSEAILKNSTATRVVIDHHQQPLVEDFDIIISDHTKSSTSLMVAQTIEALGLWESVGLAEAEALYLGMMTDTGNFTYGNLTPELFLSVAKVVAVGVKPNLFYSKIFDTKSESQIRLRAYALSEKMYIDHKLKCGYITLTKAELERYNFVEGDIEGLVNVPLSIAGIENSAIFVEKKDLVKISLRSLLSGVDVNQFARNNYIGGGHINAAGGKFYGTLDEAAKIYIDGLNKLISEK